MSFRVFEMRRDSKEIPQVEISCVPFDEQYLEQYKSMYNAAFRPMREALNISPYDWYHDSSKILDKASDIYILVAEWNQSAVQMYKNAGFKIVKTEDVSV